MPLGLWHFAQSVGVCSLVDNNNNNNNISKAFDRVWNKVLLAKLPVYGFTPFSYRLISILLSSCFIFVVVNGTSVRSSVVFLMIVSFDPHTFFFSYLFFMNLSQMLTPLPIIQPFINIFLYRASLPLMLFLNLTLLNLLLLTQICRTFLGGNLKFS